jgi:hypothetical protein
MTAPGSPPRRSDRILLGSLLLVLALVTTLSPIRNYDYWWHLKTGALVVERGEVPRSDPYSFTAAGTPWVDHEWLAQVVMFLVHRSAGPALLVLLKSGLLCGLAFWAARHLEREGHGPAGTAVLLVPALIGGAFRFDVRPELATLLLVPASLALALRARRTASRVPLIGIAALTVVGANLHVGVILLPVFLALAAAATFVWGALGRGEQESHGVEPDHGRRTTGFALSLLATAFATALLIGANPYGYRLYRVPFDLRALLSGLPWPNLEWVRPTFETLPLLYVCGGASLMILLLGRKSLDPITAPALVASLALALLHARNAGLFFLLLPWGLARPLRALVERLKTTPLYLRGTGGDAVRPGFIAASVLLVCGVPLLFWLQPQTGLGLGVARDNDPSGLVDFLQRERVTGFLYNDVKFGGYLVWRRYPETQVFIDSRNEIYGDLLHDIARSMQEPQTWKAFLERRGIEAAMLRYQPTLQKVLYTSPDGTQHPGERAFAATYFPQSDWAVVFWDDEGMILVRRDAAHQDVIARQEYRALHPEDWRFQWAGALIGQVPAGPILADLERKLREDPHCARALELQKRFAMFTSNAAENAPGGAGR